MVRSIWPSSDPGSFRPVALSQHHAVLLTMLGSAIYNGVQAWRRYSVIVLA